MKVTMNLKLTFDEQVFEKSWTFQESSGVINFKHLYAEIKWAINYRLKHIIKEHKLFVAREQEKQNE